MSDRPTKDHNTKSRNKIITECAVEMTRIQTQRQALNEQAGDIRTRLRDSSIHVSSFMAALSIKEMGDDEARDAYLDGLSEAFEALGIGDQLTMFDGPRHRCLNTRSGRRRFSAKWRARRTAESW